MASTTPSASDSTTTTTNPTDAAKDAFSTVTGQVKDLAKRKPYAFAALAGVLGIALINTLRGK